MEMRAMKHKDIYVKGRWVASIGIEKKEVLEWLRERGEHLELSEIAKPLSEIANWWSY